MNINTLRKAAIAPFIKLVENEGSLSGGHYIGMGFKGDFLYLVELGRRPERVTVVDGEFAFLSKKADGGIVTNEFNSTNETILEGYTFNDGKSFSQVMALHDSTEEKELLVVTLNTLMETIGEATEVNRTDVEEELRRAFHNLVAEVVVDETVAEPEPVLGEKPECTPLEKAKGLGRFQKAFMTNLGYAA